MGGSQTGKVHGETNCGKILIKNASAIVCCNDSDDVYRNADMLIEGEKILEIGYGISCPDARIMDAHGKFIYPGLVNTHHHFFQTFVRNLMTIDYPSMQVVEWIDKIYRIFQKIDSDVIYYSSLTAMADLVKHGCTTAFDHQYCYTVHTKKEPVDRQMEAAAQIGIRYHAGRGANTLARSQGSSIPDDMLETTEEFIQDTRRLIGRYHDTSPYSMSQIVIAPCQPVNCYKDTFIESVRLARETGARLHTHLGEGESPIMEQRWGIRTVEWLEQIGFINENAWFAHCWELTDEEYKILGEHGCGISHCPTPAVLGGFPIIPMKKLQEYGILLSLGCDGSATNDGSNLLDSVRLAYMMQCYNSKARGGCVSAYEILKQATLGGARTLGRTDIGSLEAGKAADLFMIDAGTLELTGAVHDPCNIIARVGLTGNVDMTMINGRVVYENGMLLTVDERRLAAEGENVCNKVLRETCEAFRG